MRDITRVDVKFENGFEIVAIGAALGLMNVGLMKFGYDTAVDVYHYVSSARIEKGAWKRPFESCTFKKVTKFALQVFCAGVFLFVNIQTKGAPLFLSAVVLLVGALTHQGVKTCKAISSFFNS